MKYVQFVVMCIIIKFTLRKDFVNLWNKVSKENLEVMFNNDHNNIFFFSSAMKPS